MAVDRLFSLAFGLLAIVPMYRVGCECGGTPFVPPDAGVDGGAPDAGLDAGADAGLDAGAPAVLPAFPQAPRWNDYRLRDQRDRSLFEQAGLPCDVDLDAGPLATACFHAGVLRRYHVVKATACDGLTATDDLGGLVWVCRATDAGVEFVSTGLSDSSELSRLISSTGFKPNTLLVRDELGALVEASAPGVWWDNPVLPLDADTTRVLELDQPGAVYLVESTRLSSGVRFAADGVSLVIAPGATLQLVPDAGVPLPPGRRTAPLVSASGRRHLWLEGALQLADRFNEPASATGVNWTEVSFSVARHLSLESGGYGAVIERGGANRFEGLRTANAFRFPFILANSAGNVFFDVVSSNYGGGNAGSSHLIEQGASRNHLVKLLAVNAGPYGVLLQDSDDTVVSHATLGNLTFSGLSIGASKRTVLSQLAIVNTGVHGLIVGLVRAEAAQLGPVVSAHATNAITFNDFDGLVVRHRLAVNGNSTDCAWSCGLPDGGFACTGGNFVARNSQCAAVGVDTERNVDLSGAFVGAVTSDAINTAGDGGVATGAEISQWTRFESPERAWGRPGITSFPNSALGRRCTSADGGLACQIMSWRVARGSTVLESAHDAGVFAAGRSCPLSVGGDVTMTADGRPFLANAVERMNDAIGDDDGLCQSNEACVYSPWLGYWQGSGALVGPCTFAPGAVVGVQLFAHPSTP